jgi:hypothetical protein
MHQINVGTKCRQHSNVHRAKTQLLNFIEGLGQGQVPEADAGAADTVLHL